MAPDAQLTWREGMHGASKVTCQSVSRAVRGIRIPLSRDDDDLISTSVGEVACS